ncbi:WD40-repeat-containing domain protein [Baffinella frigidus]|nr:WD40-repeat-containing domain protein [Cryptophyta sp. CCMP2293]
MKHGHGKTRQYKQPAVFEKKEELLPLCKEIGFRADVKVIQGPKGESVRTLAWLSNNNIVTAGDDGDLTTHDLANNSTTSVPASHERVWSVATTPDGSLSASGGKDGAVVLWTPTKAVIGTARGHSSEVNSVAFNDTGKLLASASDDGTVIIWDVSRPADPFKSSVLEGHKGWVRCSSKPPFMTLRIWTISPSGAPLACHIDDHHHSLSLRDIAFSPLWTSHGGMLATACFDNVVRLFSLHVESGADESGAGLVKEVHFKQSLFGHPSGVWAVCWSPDGSLLASAGFDNLVRLWKMGGHRARERFAPATGHTGAICSMAFSPDGKSLASASCDGTTRIWALREAATANESG